MKKIFLLHLILLINFSLSAQNVLFKESRINYQVGRSPWGVASSDFNNDGNPDIVTCSREERSVTVLFGNGDGNFFKPDRF